MGSQIRLLAFGFIFEVKLEVEEGAFPAKNRHYYPPPPTTGTREALMERRAAPYPYSKMCELCELCELLERKIPPLPRWDLLYLSAAEFIRCLRSLLTKTPHERYRETSSASRRGLRGLETRLL